MITSTSPLRADARASRSATGSLQCTTSPWTSTTMRASPMNRSALRASPAALVIPSRSISFAIAVACCCSASSTSARARPCTIQSTPMTSAETTARATMIATATRARIVRGRSRCSSCPHATGSSL